MSAPVNSRMFRMHGLLPFILLATGVSFPQNPPVEMRYKLVAGDRLVYREVFDREGK